MQKHWRRHTLPIAPRSNKPTQVVQQPAIIRKSHTTPLCTHPLPLHSHSPSPPNLLNSKRITSNAIIMLNTLPPTVNPVRNILVLGRILSMQIIEVVIGTIKGACVTRLQLEPVGEACIGRVETLPVALIDGAVECEWSLLGRPAAVLSPDVDLYQGGGG